MKDKIKWSQALNEIDPSYIAEASGLAEEGNSQKRAPRPLRAAIVAVLLCALVVGGLLGSFGLSGVDARDPEIIDLGFFFLLPRWLRPKEMFPAGDSEAELFFADFELGMSSEEMLESETDWFKRFVADYIADNHGEGIDDCSCSDGYRVSSTGDGDSYAPLTTLSENKLISIGVEITLSGEPTLAEFFPRAEAYYEKFLARYELSPVEPTEDGTAMYNEVRPLGYEREFSPDGTLTDAGYEVDAAEYRYWVDEENEIGYQFVMRHYTKPDDVSGDYEDNIGIVSCCMFYYEDK